MAGETAGGMTDDAGLWTVQDLAAFLGKPPSWVYDNYRTEFAGCFVRLGQHIRFFPDAIRGHLNDRMRPPRIRG